MPSIAQRAQIMPPSPIRKLAPLADEAKRRGISVFHLNIGQPDIATPQGMLDAFRHHEIRVLAYGHSGGLWEYRENLAKSYRSVGIDVTKDQVFITTAGSEALQFAFLAIADPGDELIIPEPFYSNYNGFAVESGLEVVPVPSRVEDGYCLPSREELVARITPRSRAIVICNPSNPTGYVYSRAEMECLRTIALEHDLFLISDEVYRDFVYDGAVWTSVHHLPGMEERAILVDSVSKRYSACGARIGCIVTKNTEVLDAALRFGQARLCPPTMEQLAANAALETPPSYLAEVREEYRRRRDAAFEALSRIPGVIASKPQGAFYSMVKLPVDSADRFCAWLLSDFSDQGETVMLAPANGFYATPGLGEQEVRLAFVLNVAAIRRSMEILEKALAVYPGRI